MSSDLTQDIKNAVMKDFAKFFTKSIQDDNSIVGSLDIGEFVRFSMLLEEYSGCKLELKAYIPELDDEVKVSDPE